MKNIITRIFILIFCKEVDQPKKLLCGAESNACLDITTKEHYEQYEQILKLNVSLSTNEAISQLQHEEK